MASERVFCCLSLSSQRSLAEAWEAHRYVQMREPGRLLLCEEHSQAPLDFARNAEALAQGSRQRWLCIRQATQAFLHRTKIYEVLSLAGHKGKGGN